MMQFCSPTVYWHFNVGKIDLGQLEEKCLESNEWNCLIKTSRGINYNWKNFLNFVKPYFLQLPFREDGYLKFDEPWMNVYNYGDFQESHHHISNGNQLSYCYFYKLPENSGKFSFWNEQFRHYCSNSLNEILQFDNVFEWIIPNVKEGDLLIFPSFLIHQVTTHKNKNIRVTVSGNLKINFYSKTMHV